jgi:hypothetical protein
MGKSLTHLLSIASDPIAPAMVADQSHFQALAGSRGRELLDLLALRNGFYAFESALLLRPLDSDGIPVGNRQWNKRGLWRSNYKTDLADVVFFAEDVFGTQFCIRNDAVNLFDPETGEFKVIAATIKDWAQWIFEDPKVRTGWPLGHF